MRPKKILVVEDEVVHARALGRLLEARGYSVKLEADGYQGVKSALEWGPDLVLMDIRLPRLNGFAAAARLRQDHRTSRIPIIAMTGCDEPADHLQGLMAGVSRYLTKPCAERELVASIEELLDQAEQAAKRQVLAVRRRDFEEMIELSPDREQILRGTLGALQKVVECDLFAILWKAGAHVNLMAVADTSDPAALVDEVLRHIDHDESIDGAIRVILADETRASDARPLDAITAGLSIPLCQADQCFGMLFVGSCERAAFDAAEAEAIANIAPVVARLCARGIELDLVPEPSVDHLVRELDVLLLIAPDVAEQWSARIEQSVGGLRVHALPDVTQIAEGVDYSVALVAPARADFFDQAMLDRGRTGQPVVPMVTMNVDDLSDSQPRLARFTLMAVLIGFMDARRSGCLHVQHQGGESGGLIVFFGGRIAWAIRSGSDASLALSLSRQGLDPVVYRRAVRTSLSEQIGIAEVLKREGSLGSDEFRMALKDYLVTVVGELLRTERPQLFLSQQVTAGSHNVSFDVDEITLEVFA